MNGQLLLRDATTSDAVLKPTPPPPVAVKISGICRRAHQLAEVPGVRWRELQSRRRAFDRGDLRYWRSHPNSASDILTGRG
jgi:hypothetical protein